MNFTGKFYNTIRIKFHQISETANQRCCKLIYTVSNNYANQLKMRDLSFGNEGDFSAETVDCV